MSPGNAPVVRELWANTPSPDNLTGITGFAHTKGGAAEDQLLAELGMIDLHHRRYSTSIPYSMLTVIGAQFAEPVRTALSESGFSTFQQRPGGFAAPACTPKGHDGTTNTNCRLSGVSVGLIGSLIGVHWSLALSATVMLVLAGGLLTLPRSAADRSVG